MRDLYLPNDARITTGLRTEVYKLVYWVIVKSKKGECEVPYGVCERGIGKSRWVRSSSEIKGQKKEYVRRKSMFGSFLH